MAKQIVNTAETSEGAPRSKASWVLILAMLYLCFLFAAIGIGSIWSSVTGTTVAEPPQLLFEQTSPITFDNVEADTLFNYSVQIEELTDPAPRIVWSLATAIKLFGYSALTAIGLVIVINLKAVSFFSEEIFRLLRMGMLVALAPILAQTVQYFSVGWLASSYGLDGIAGFEVFKASPLGVSGIFGIWGIYLAISFVLRQGMALQAAVDETV